MPTCDCGRLTDAAHLILRGSTDLPSRVEVTLTVAGMVPAPVALACPSITIEFGYLVAESRPAPATAAENREERTRVPISSLRMRVSSFSRGRR